MHDDARPWKDACQAAVPSFCTVVLLVITSNIWGMAMCPSRIGIRKLMIYICEIIDPFGRGYDTYISMDEGKLVSVQSFHLGRGFQRNLISYPGTPRLSLSTTLRSNGQTLDWLNLPPLTILELEFSNHTRKKGPLLPRPGNPWIHFFRSKCRKERHNPRKVCREHQAHDAQ